MTSSLLTNRNAGAEYDRVENEEKQGQPAARALRIDSLGTFCQVAYGGTCKRRIGTGSTIISVFAKKSMNLFGRTLSKG